MRATKSKFTDVEFSLTGFGKFGEVLHNPTTELMSKIRQILTEQQTRVGITQILTVAAEDVEVQLLGIYNCLDIRQRENNDVKQCLLHFGVVHREAISLEKLGWNKADFLIPDEREWEPKQRTINYNFAYEH